MNAMERLINGYFDLKEQAERNQSDNLIQILRLDDENKRLKEEIAELEKETKKSNTEIIKAFINRFADDKLLTEQQRQMLLSYVREINREDEEEEDE
jgi:hypothetical protein